MKKLLILLLAVLLLAGCAETYDGPTETEYVLTEMTRVQYWTDGTVFTARRTGYTYDIYGNLAQEMEYGVNDPILEIVYTYDDRGNRIEAERYNPSGWFQKRIGRTEYTYDEQDRLIREVREDLGEIYEFSYTYDDEANTLTTGSPDGVLVEYFDENGFVVRREYTAETESWWNEYTWRPDGQPLTERGTDGTGAEYELRWDYDDAGRLAEMRRWEAGELNYHYQYEYDEQGRQVRLVELLDGGKAELSRREYNDVQRSMTVYSRGEKSHTIFYDADGREIERLEYDSDDGSVGMRTTWTYTAIQVPEKEETP